MIARFPVLPCLYVCLICLLLPACARRTTIVKADGTTVTHVHRPLRRDVTIIHHEADGPAEVSADESPIDQEPPEIIIETRPAAPSVRHVWVAGYWHWRGGRYVWVKGAWAIPPRGVAVWVPGRYNRAGRHWVWVPGRWN